VTKILLNWTPSMNEPPHEWLRQLFEFEYCPECGGDAEDHDVILVLGNYFARCSRSPFADITGSVRTVPSPIEQDDEDHRILHVPCLTPAEGA
jgi:hypothetical protein